MLCARTFLFALLVATNLCGVVHVLVVRVAEAMSYNSY